MKPTPLPEYYIGRKVGFVAVLDKKYEEVYRWLLAYIDENRFSENQKLPSENALCSRLKMSRDTIRRAIDLLIQEGLVYTVKGSGTYFYRDKILQHEVYSGNGRETIGLILQGQNPDADVSMISGLRSVLSEEDVELRIFLTDNLFYNERRCLQTVIHQNFSGFIVDGVKASIMNPNVDCYKEFYRKKIPMIFHDNYYKDLNYPKVIMDDQRCSDELVGRLIDAGHRKIAGFFIQDNYQGVEKLRGMVKAMQKRNVEFNDHYIRLCISAEAHKQNYVRSIIKFIKTIPECTAIVCCNYIICCLVQQALSQMGKTVPEDYSLVCFDYTGRNWQANPVTCSMEQGYEMGRQMAIRLMQMIRNQDWDYKDYTCVFKPLIYDGTSIKKLV